MAATLLTCTCPASCAPPQDLSWLLAPSPCASVALQPEHMAAAARAAAGGTPAPSGQVAALPFFSPVMPSAGGVGLTPGLTPGVQFGALAAPQAAAAASGAPSATSCGLPFMTPGPAVRACREPQSGDSATLG
jgi:hypothetical protein